MTGSIGVPEGWAPTALREGIVNFIDQDRRREIGIGRLLAAQAIEDPSASPTLLYEAWARNLC
eukprot:575897-Heterocapsa_arctica.AAC.1